MGTSSIYVHVHMYISIDRSMMCGNGNVYSYIWFFINVPFSESSTKEKYVLHHSIIRANACNKENSRNKNTYT